MRKRCCGRLPHGSRPIRTCSRCRRYSAIGWIHPRVTACRRSSRLTRLLRSSGTWSARSCRRTRQGGHRTCWHESSFHLRLRSDRGSHDHPLEEHMMRSHLLRNHSRDVGAGRWRGASRCAIAHQGEDQARLERRCTARPILPWQAEWVLQGRGTRPRCHLGIGLIRHDQADRLQGRGIRPRRRAGAGARRATARSGKVDRGLLPDAHRLC